MKTLLINLTKTCSRILFLAFLICFIINLTIKPHAMTYRQKWIDNDSAWMTTKHGDLAAFSMFLKENLFGNSKENYLDCELLIPNPKGYNKSQFLGKFWRHIPLIYLFPLEINISKESSQPLCAEDFERLKKFPLLERKYRSSFLHQKRFFYLLSHLKCSDYKKWTVNTYSEGDVEHVFVVPIDFNPLNPPKK